MKIQSELPNLSCGGRRRDRRGLRVAGRDEGLGRLANGEGNEVIGAVGERGGDGDRDRLEDLLQVSGDNGGIAIRGVANAVGGLLHGGLLRNLRGGKEVDLGGFSHNAVF